MSINVKTALECAPTVRHISWTERDVLLYHLSLGAGRGGDDELALTYERDLRVLPTFALVAGQGISAGARTATGLTLPGIDVDLARLLHAGQNVTVHRAIPTCGTAFLSTAVTHVWDKGIDALIELEHRATTCHDVPLWTSIMSIWARGEGGFGGSRGPQAGPQAPDRAPDSTFEVTTAADQALLYRLNGDLNPLHVDPAFARAAGLDRPILHGLASLGILTKGLGTALLDAEWGRVHSVTARFAGVLYPGETMRVRTWHTDAGIAFVASCAERNDAAVLTHGRVEVVAADALNSRCRHTSAAQRNRHVSLDETDAGQGL
ncbi:MaoC/PaaZ C-terminal domain-containing protein [Mycobacterium sherrisii]|uniref:MaoC/PaaZ C-terminal domain-containing protein n=1 Tax=Mycobacterium sherrisii TaxID=243061 RepID=UPI003974D347